MLPRSPTRIHHLPMPKAAALLPLALLTFVLAGCKKQDQVRFYQAPKDEPSPLTATPALPPAQQPAAGSKPLWQKPEGWTEKPASAMRLASFSSAEKDGETADISVVTLGGPAGGALANVNRWRGQIGLAAVDEPGLAPLLTDMQIDGKPARLLDMAGTEPPEGKTKPQRTIVAMVEVAGQTWFFKMSGEDTVVAAEKPAFLAFLNSVHFP